MNVLLALAASALWGTSDFGGGLMSRRLDPSAAVLISQAIALAGQLSAVNPDSPYIDQILLLAAECDLAQGERARAIARLESLLKSYPGSPLVPAVKEKLSAWKGGTK